MAIPLNVHFPEDIIRALDNWRREQPDLPTRQEAIRRIIAATVLPGVTHWAMPSRRGKP
jgi:hypothetical protein